VRVQARIFQWHSENGTDVYSPSDDIGFSPAIFEIGPNASQVLRIVVLSPRGAQEAAYRLFIDQLPDTARGRAVGMPIRFAVPVFLAGGNDKAAPQLTWQAVADRKLGRVTLTATNIGNQHARIENFAYDAAGQKGVIASGLAGYVLAGETESWHFTLHGPVQSLDIRAQTDQGEIHETVPLTAR
jgi:fimbrial chaperone protein